MICDCCGKEKSDLLTIDLVASHLVLNDSRTRYEHVDPHPAELHVSEECLLEPWTKARKKFRFVMGFFVFGLVFICLSPVFVSLILPPSQQSLILIALVPLFISFCLFGLTGKYFEFRKLAKYLRQRKEPGKNTEEAMPYFLMNRLHKMNIAKINGWNIFTPQEYSRILVNQINASLNNTIYLIALFPNNQNEDLLKKLLSEIENGYRQHFRKNVKLIESFFIDSLPMGPDSFVISTCLMACRQNNINFNSAKDEISYSIDTVLGVNVGVCRITII